MFTTEVPEASIASHKRHSDSISSFASVTVLRASRFGHRCASRFIRRLEQCSCNHQPECKGPDVPCTYHALARIIHERFCCNSGFAATTNLDPIRERPGRRARRSVGRHTVSSMPPFVTHHQLIGIAPAPILSRLKRLHDWMLRLAEVFRRVGILR